MNKIKSVEKINDLEVSRGVSDSGSWHNRYSHSSWVYVGGLDYDFTEGDVITVFSQYDAVRGVADGDDPQVWRDRGYLPCARHEDGEEQGVLLSLVRESEEHGARCRQHERLHGIVGLGAEGGG